MFEIIDPETLSVLERERLEKLHSSVDRWNVKHICDHVTGYPEIIAAVSELLQSPHSATYDHELKLWRYERFNPKSEGVND